MASFQVRPLTDADQQWVSDTLSKYWASSRLVSRGRMHQGEQLPGFAAVMDGKPVGLALYHVEGDQCELVSLTSEVEGIGIGSALIQAVRGTATSYGCRRLWLITTNDNTPALRFYQRRGFVLAALHPNALERSRQLKPEIPLTGLDGIPIRDEIELEMAL